MKHYVTATHWGVYNVKVTDNEVTHVEPALADRDPSAIGRSLTESCTHKVRIEQPMVREGWLKDPETKNRQQRGRDPFVKVSWETAIDLVSAELRRVKDHHGNSSIYAGSYGWASAGRFHHAQSQLGRFLNLFGGHTNTVNTYSFAAAEVIVPHIVGSFFDVLFAGTTIANIAQHGELVVAFGGWPAKNSQANSGGVSRHEAMSAQRHCKEAGVEFVCIGPNKGDMAGFLNAEWLQVRPTTDIAVMLGLAHTLYEENLYNAEFLSTHCVGFEPFRCYLLGINDGVVKNADWAAEVSGLSADSIRRLARKMGTSRTFLSASWSLQRAEYGEQPYWMLIVLAAMLGQIGLPGAGFGFGHSAVEGIGTRWDHPVRPASLPIPENPVKDVFPVSRIADLLLNTGKACDFNGKQWDGLLLTLSNRRRCARMVIARPPFKGRGEAQMNITRVGVDIAKSVFHVHAVDSRDRLQWQCKLKRSQWIDALCERLSPGAEVGMEACASAHHWARELQKRGYHVRLIAAQFVKPYVKSNKNDRVDAEAICEAMGRPGMRFVRAKTVAQQDIQAAHRIREELVGQRTAKANQIRGLAGEYGIVAPTGIRRLRQALPRWLEDAENGLTQDFRVLMAGLAEDLCYLDKRIQALDERIAQYVKQDPVARRLMELRGVGPLTASALAGALGDGKAFGKGREFAASLGLTPRQHSTGGKDRLLGISKRGDSYLRKLLVHGARAVIRHAKGRDDGLSQWLRELSARKHVNVVIVALVNKTARVAWAMVHNDTAYDPVLVTEHQVA